MTDIYVFPGLEDEDTSAIAAVWNAPDAKLQTLIKAGNLNPKTDFVRGNFRGWPLAGEDVRGIDFSGSDLRGTGIEHAIRDETTILTGAIIDDTPLADSKLPSRKIEVRQSAGNAWAYHWHSAVHHAFGNKLHFILVRFVTGSIFVKDSIIHNLQEANINDFMIFNLYSQWDIAIRAWGDDKSIRTLKQKLVENAEVHEHQPPQFFEIKEIIHFPDRGIYPSREDVNVVLINTPTEQLKDAQEKGTKSPFFEPLNAAGLIMANETRFANKRIQFYILINSTQPASQLLRTSLLSVVKSSKTIKNRTVYLTSSGATQAIVKGQALPTRYYDIHAFLRRLTDELQVALRLYIETETTLVANQDSRHAALIDFNNAVRDHSVAISERADTLIERGEGDETEFKSTLRVNLHTGQKDPRMELEVLKTVAAFVNSKGGTLVIGVDDNGKALGLEADKFGNEDKMNRHLVSLIRDKIGPQHMAFIRVRFSDYENMRVLIVECQRGRAPVYVKDGGTEHFFMRTGAATTELTGSQLQEFLKHRFLN